jgi:hypothetical protein
MRGWLLGMSAVAVSLIVGGCRSEPSTTTSSPPEQPAGTEVASHDAEQAPVVLTLETKAIDKGLYEILAHVDARAEYAIPVTLTIDVPQGGTLVDGELRQTLPGLIKGRNTRAFRVSMPDGAEPVKVTVDGKHPKGAYGFHAERLFPEQVKNTAFVTPKRAPMARPPVAPRVQRPVVGGVQ